MFMEINRCRQSIEILEGYKQKLTDKRSLFLQTVKSMDSNNYSNQYFIGKQYEQYQFETEQNDTILQNKVIRSYQMNLTSIDSELNRLKSRLEQLRQLAGVK